MFYLHLVMGLVASNFRLILCMSTNSRHVTIFDNGCKKTFVIFVMCTRLLKLCFKHSPLRERYVCSWLVHCKFHFKPHRVSVTDSWWHSCAMFWSTSFLPSAMLVRSTCHDYYIHLIMAGWMCIILFRHDPMNYSGFS